MFFSDSVVLVEMRLLRVTVIKNEQALGTWMYPKGR